LGSSEELGARKQRNKENILNKKERTYRKTYVTKQ
jgi:hypothetical protein